MRALWLAPTPLALSLRLCRCWLLAALFCAPHLARASAEKTLAVGWDSYPPYQMETSGAAMGIDMEIISAALKRAGFSARFVQLPWARQLAMARSGELDIVMNASRSADRAEYAQWSIPYRQERVALVSLETNNRRYTSLEQLIGRPVRIGVIRGSVYGADFETAAANPRFAKLLDFAPLNTTNIKKLYAGRIDYIIDDPVTIEHQSRQFAPPKVHIALELKGDRTAFLVSKKTLLRHPGLLERLNTALTQMESSGVTRNILAKYALGR